MIDGIRKSIVLKTAFLFIVVAVTPYLLANLLFFSSSRKALYNEITNGMKTKVSLVRNAIDTRLSLLRGNAIAWAGLEVMKDIMTDDIDKRIDTVITGLKRDYGIAGEIHAINKKGQVISSTEALNIGKVINASWFSKAMSGEMVELDAHKSEIDGDYVVSFAVPVKPSIAGYNVIGMFLVEYHVESLGDILSSGDIPFAVVLKKNGETVKALSGGPFHDRNFLERLLGVGGDLVYQSGYIVAVADSRGLFDFRGFGWKVAVAVEEEKALQPVRRIEKISALVGLAGILLIFGMVSFFARRAVRPLKELSKIADYVARTKDFSISVGSTSKDEVGTLASAFNHMVEEVKTHIYNLQRANIELLEVLGSAIAKRDSDTNTHNYRVTIISIRLAERLGLGTDGIKTLIKGSFLHDVGKIGISDNILIKPGKLTAEEYEIMKGHVRHGVDIIQSYNWLRDAVDVVLNHHEKYDGSGYPAGKRGEDIPINARIFAIADVFDALTSNRPYRRPLSYEETMEILEPDRGVHFDPEIFDIFKRVSKEIYAEVAVAEEKVIKNDLNNRISKYFTSVGEDRGT